VMQKHQIVDLPSDQLRKQLIAHYWRRQWVRDWTLRFIDFVPRATTPLRTNSDVMLRNIDREEYLEQHYPRSYYGSRSQSGTQEERPTDMEMLLLKQGAMFVDTWDLEVFQKSPKTKSERIAILQQYLLKGLYSSDYDRYDLVKLLKPQE